MDTQEIVDILRFAIGNERAVRLLTREGIEVLGVPSSLDDAPDAREVFLRPSGDDATEIAVALAAITRADLI